MIFQVKFKSKRCSDKTVPYNKCLEFTAPTELKITKDDAPAENNCRKIIWDAPPKIITDIAIVVNGVNPKSIAKTPKIIPNGTTGIIKGLVSFIPLKKICDLLFINQTFIRSKLYDQYELVF